MAIVYSGDNITFGDGSIIAGVATQNNVYNVVTANANTGVGNTTVTFTSNTAAINVGMIIYGGGFGRGATVSSFINANTLVVSTAAANTATNTKISFVEPNRVVTADVAGPGLCKAWVNFKGTGTVAIRNAFNVSSITDRGTGQYTVNFTQAMPDANYCGVVTTRRSTSKDAQGLGSLGPANSAGTDLPMATGSVDVATGVTSSGAFTDFDFVCVSIFR
jgi:hypothetical protein